MTAADFDVEDLATAFLRLDGGGTLLLESSWAQWIPYDQCYVTVYGSEGGASIEWGGEPGEHYRKLGIWTEKDGVPAQLTPVVPPDGQHLETVIDFLAAVRNGSRRRARRIRGTRTGCGRRCLLRLGRAARGGHPRVVR